MTKILGRIVTPNLPSAPSSPNLGELYYDTGTNTLLWWNGTAWVSGGGGAAEVDISTGGPSPRVGQMLWVDTDDSPAMVGTNPAFASVEAKAAGTTFSTGGADTGLWNVDLACSGARLLILGTFQVGGDTSGARVRLEVRMDNVVQVNGYINAVASGSYYTLVMHRVITPSAGSHNFKVWGFTGGGLGNMSAADTSILTLAEQGAL